MNLLKKMFYKKVYLKSLDDYLIYYEKNKLIDFQMDIMRNDIMDIQILSSKIEKQDERLNNQNDFVILLAFTEHLSDREMVLKRFKKSPIYSKSIFLENFDLKDRWLYRVPKDVDILQSELVHIINSIFDYSKDKYQVGFYEFTKDDNLININHYYQRLI